MFKLKKFLISTLFVAFTVSLAFGAGPKEEQAAKVTPEGEPQYGGIITNFIGWEAETPSADIADRTWATHMFANPVMEHLLQGDFEKYGPRGSGDWSFQVEAITPEQYCKGTLVDDWDVTAEQITFHVRPGVYWAADGKEHVMESRELTAEDLVYGLNRYLDFDQGFLRTENGGFVSSVYAKGDMMVVETSSFNADWVSSLAMGHSNMIYPREVVEAGASDWDNLVGTGPFMFGEYVVGSHFSYIRNPNYYDKTNIDGVEYDVPFVDEMKWPIIPDESTQVASLRTGKIDIWHAVPNEYKETLEKTSSGLSLKPYGHPNYRFLSLNCSKEPLNNVEVRRALMIGLDRATMRDAIIPNGSLYSFPINEQLTGRYTPVDELPPEARELYEYNEDKARQMIIDAGYPDGIDGIEIVAMSREQDYVDWATMAAAYWQAIGVRATVRPMETTAHTAYVNSDDYMVDVGTTTTINNLRTFREYYVPRTEEKPNRPHYDNPYFTERYFEAAETIDIAEQNAILKELGVIAMQDVPCIPLAGGVFYSGWWDWVKNYYGEVEASAYAPGTLCAYAWLDLDLKKEMGY
jgi:peptide/nickel transport system substrate-binding protein